MANIQSPFAVHAPFNRIEPKNLRTHYEDVAENMLRSIMRWKWLILGIVLVALALAGLLAHVLPRTYVAEAIVHSNLAIASSDENTATHVGDLRGSVLVASEAEFIRSRAMARKVATRLKMDKYTAFNREDTNVWPLSVIKSILLPAVPPKSALERATDHLIQISSVKTSVVSYNITITASWDSSHRAAEIANAFVKEYLQAKNQQQLLVDLTSAQRELEKASATYGSKHPAMSRAQRNLQTAKAAAQRHADIGATDNVPPSQRAGVTLADPIFPATSPNIGIVFLLVPALGLIFGIFLVTWFEHRNTGFRGANDAQSYTGLECIGLLPEIPQAESTRQSFEVRQSLRSIGIEARLIDSFDAGAPKVLMITSSISGELTKSIARSLMSTLNNPKKRTLLIAPKSLLTKPKFGNHEKKQGATRLDEINTSSVMRQAFFDGFDAQTKPAVFEIELTENSSRAGIDSSMEAWDGFLSTARKCFELIVIITPPIFVFADASLIARSTDLILYIAKWRATPRRIVQAGVSRLNADRQKDVRLVLTDVDYRSSVFPDRFSL